MLYYKQLNILCGNALRSTLNSWTLNVEHFPRNYTENIALQSWLLGNLDSFLSKLSE